MASKATLPITENINVYANGLCGKCGGTGETGINMESGEPSICDCVHYFTPQEDSVLLGSSSFKDALGEE